MFLQTVQVEVGDDPSKPQVIAPDGSRKSPTKAVKEEIIIEKCDCDDDDAPDGDNIKVENHSFQCY